MRSKYDVIVIGAGPAGSVAAHEAAVAGASVLLLEKHKRPGIPLCCAEAVSGPSIGKYLSIPQNWISTRVGRVKLVAPDGSAGVIKHPDAGYVLDRKIFDYELARRAVSAGCELECEAIGTGLAGEDGKYHSIDVLKPDGSGVKVEADIFIAADGVESKIAREAGIDNLIESKDIESLLQYRVEGINVEPDMVEFHIGNKIAPHGYIWVFPKSATSANVGLGIAATLEKGSNTSVRLDRFLEGRFGGSYKITEKYCGMVPRYQGVDKFRAGNLLVVGDAARAVDSLSGAGIVNAVMSGIFAGRAAAAFAAEKGMKEEELHRLYPGKFLEIKGEELERYARYRTAYNKLNDEDLNEIVSFVGDYFGDKTVTSLNILKIMANLIAKRPKLIRLARYLL